MRLYPVLACVPAALGTRIRIKNQLQVQPQIQEQLRGALEGNLDGFFDVARDFFSGAGEGTQMQSIQVNLDFDEEGNPVVEMCQEYEERCFPNTEADQPLENCESVWVGGCPFSSEEAPCGTYFQCSEEEPDICFQTCN